MAREGESIASDRGGADFFQLLPADTISRMADKFSSFQEDRAKIHDRMESYVRDYGVYEGSAARRYEMLEDEYADGAPDLSHLVLREDGSAASALWSMRDMAIILGRNVSSVLRTIRKMNDRPEWSAILAAREYRQEKNGRDASVLYDSGIFEVIVDYFESVYLERLTCPRHGKPMTDEERRAAYSLWNYMKANPDAAEKLGANGILERGPMYGAVTDRARPTLYGNMRGMIKRAFSIKPGAFFLLLFALFYELSRKYPFLNVTVPVVSVAVFICALAAMNRRGQVLPLFEDIGACTITLVLFWSLAMVASPDGPAARLLPSPNAGNALPPAVTGHAYNSKRREEILEEISKAVGEAYYSERLKEIMEGVSQTTGVPGISAGADERQEVRVVYLRSRGDGKFDVLIYTSPWTREILYRTSASGDFRSTGFLEGESKLPIRYVTLDPESAANLWIKYVDVTGEIHGPYEINFDSAAERMKEARRRLDEDIQWVDFSMDGDGTSVVTNVASELALHLRDANIVKRVMYGVNKRTPNMERNFPPGDETNDYLPDYVRIKSQSYLLADSKEKIWFVSMKIIFSDGSESDVRIFDNPYAEVE
ncbi:MAG: hypothetical protein LBO21_10655 [Synergistaceae bacterium]|jgi:hypothetical protein|nr:hypothetical protein [Synergistaceae bacterium]